MANRQINGWLSQMNDAPAEPLPAVKPEPTPMEATREWVVFICGIALCGLSFLVIEGWLLSPRGSFGPTILQAAQPGPAVVAMALALGVCFIIAVGVARLLKSPNKGLVVVGLGLGWLAWRLKGVETIAFSGSFSVLAIEGLIWTAVVLVMVVGVFAAGGSLQYVQPRAGNQRLDDWAASKSAGILVLCGLCALPVAWLFAQSPLRGQALAAATLGAMAVGIVGRLSAPHAQPILLFMAPVLAATLAQWVLAVTMPAEQLATLFVQGEFPHLLIPVPIDWVAGSFMGVAWGYYIGNAFLHHEPDDAQLQQAA
ncbi:MAG: hypothetical protein MK116_11860 [Phycisphaerales bacterium]|nr:hypothetical protein [Phycisphaerales bacterium]